MKYITLIIGLLVAGCVSPDETLRKSVVGTYIEKHQAKDSPRMVLLENGIVEAYRNGKPAKWMVLNGELHLIYEDEVIVVLSINKDESITGIASIDKDGKREDFLKEDQHFVPTFKKIK